MNEVAARAQFDAQVAQLSPRLLASRGWELGAQMYPLLEVLFRAEGKQPLMLRMTFDGWPAQPPSVVMTTPDRRPLPKPLQGGPGIFNASNHPVTQQPFICMAGIREYHTHPSHRSDHWEQYRAKGGYDLGGVITRIWNGWLKTP